MDQGRNTYDPVLTNFKSKYAVDWSPFLNRKWTDEVGRHRLPLAEMKRSAGSASRPRPKDFALHRWCRRC